MKKLTVLPVAFVLAAIVWLQWPGGKTVVTPTSATPVLYTYGYTDTNGEYHGAGDFQASDSIGVTQAIQNALPTRNADFLYVGDKTVDRENYITSNGLTFAHASRLWDVQVVEHGTVGSSERLSVVASVGINGTVTHDLYGDGDGKDIDHQLFELWELQSGGSDPVLLERSMDFFSGVNTHAEQQPIIPDMSDSDNWDTDQPVQLDMGM